MTEPTIQCPKCNAEIKLTDSLAAPLLESAKKDFEHRLTLKNNEIAEREKQMRSREEAVTRATESVDQRVADLCRIERTKIAAEEQKKAKLASANDLELKTAELNTTLQVLQSQNAKLAIAQKAQADLVRKERELDDAKREMELSIQKQVSASVEKAREQARKEAEETLGFKVMEKEQTISAMQKQIEELKRKSEQGSQQLQGEVQEIKLESLLKAKFPRDIIEPVPKGEYGGDVLQQVINPLGRICGTILWESKRTKNWQDNWLPKLRQDQRAAKADIAVIVSQTVPMEVSNFELTDGIWIAEFSCAIPIAVALRHSLIELAGARQSAEGQQSKMEMVYQYLTGTRFRQRVQAIVEQFGEMHSDLDKERKTMVRLWAKREAQIHAVVDSTAGMYGDLQGIAGRTLQEIDGLEMKVLEPGTNLKS